MKQQIPQHVKDVIVKYAAANNPKHDYAVPFVHKISEDQMYEADIKKMEWICKHLINELGYSLALSQPAEPVWLNLAERPIELTSNSILRWADNKEPIQYSLEIVNDYNSGFYKEKDKKKIEYLNPSLTAAPKQQYEWVNMVTKEWTSDEITSALAIRWADDRKNLIPDKLKSEMKPQIHTLSKLYLSQYEYLKKNF